MDSENNEDRIYSVEEVATIQKQFRYMVEGQGIAFLIVDPSATNRRISAAALIKAGFEDIRELRDAVEAISEIDKRDARRLITLVDTALDGSQGMDYLSYIREFRRSTAQGIALLTGTRFSPAQIADAHQYGVAGIFPRPLNFQDVLEKLADLGITPDMA